MAELKKTIGLFPDSSGNYRMEINENGDYKCDNSFDTDIYISLFTDGRADSSEVQQPELRRGWEGDVVTTLEDYAIGSKIWLNYQSRWNKNTVNKMVANTERALEHFVRRKLCSRVQVSGKLLGIGQIEISAVFYIDNNIIKKFTTQLWKESVFA